MSHVNKPGVMVASPSDCDGNIKKRYMPCVWVNPCLAIVVHKKTEEWSDGPRLKCHTTITHVGTGAACAYFSGDVVDLAKRVTERFWNQLTPEVQQVWMTSTDMKELCDALPRWLVKWMRSCANKGKCSPLPPYHERV